MAKYLARYRRSPTLNSYNVKVGWVVQQHTLVVLSPGVTWLFGQVVTEDVTVLSEEVPVVIHIQYIMHPFPSRLRRHKERKIQQVIFNSTDQCISQQDESLAVNIVAWTFSKFRDSRTLTEFGS